MNSKWMDFDNTWLLCPSIGLCACPTVDEHITSELISSSPTGNMAGGVGKIELFKFIQNLYREIGICARQQFNSNYDRCLCDAKKWFIPLCLTQYLYSSIAFLLVEANLMLEYGMVFFSSITSAFCFTIYLILFWQMEHILKFIEHVERFIETSECFNTRNGWRNRIFCEFFLCFLAHRNAFSNRVQRYSWENRTIDPHVCIHLHLIQSQSRAAPVDPFLFRLLCSGCGQRCIRFVFSNLVRKIAVDVRKNQR